MPTPSSRRCTLSVSSPDLDQNQITDDLTRVVQPKLSSIAGVQRADILGDRTFAMRIWLKPELMAAHGIPPSMVRDALARNNYLSALGRTKGSMVSVNLVANTDLRTRQTPASSSSRSQTASSSASATLPTSFLAPRTTRRRSASTVRPRCS